MQRDSLDYITWLTVIIMVIPFALYAFPQLLSFSESHIVRTDSMEPNVSLGSVIFANPVESPEEISEGDLIAFWEEENRESVLVTHRVSEIQKFNQETQFKTDRKAGPRAEPRWVADYQVEGKVGLVIPVMGRIVDIMNMAIGRIFIVLTPAMLLVLNELRRIADTVDSNEIKLFDQIKG